MANPQVEDGHTKIANDIMDALSMINLSAYESRILHFLLRKTYGWGKKSDRISYTQWEVGTHLKRWHIARTIKRLIYRRIVLCSGKGYNLEYSFQKDFEQWIDFCSNGHKSLPIEVTNTITNSGNDVVTSTGNDLLPNQVTLNRGKSLPIQVESLPIQVEVLPNEVTNLLPKEVNTKAIKHITKAITKATEVDISEMELPTCIKREIWVAFVEVRKSIKKPLFAHSAEMIIKRLDKWRVTFGDDPNEVLENSIINGWQGIFALTKQPEQKKQSKNDKDKWQVR